MVLLLAVGQFSGRVWYVIPFRPIELTPPGGSSNARARRRSHDPGEWWVDARNVHPDTTPPDLPPLKGCKRKVGKAGVFVIEPVWIDSGIYYLPPVTFTNYLDSSRYYGSTGIKFYVRTEGLVALKFGVWLHDKNAFYTLPPEYEDEYMYGKGLSLIDLDFRRDLVPGVWAPPGPNSTEPNTPKNKLMIAMRVQMTHYRGKPMKVEVSELCLY